MDKGIYKYIRNVMMIDSLHKFIQYTDFSIYSNVKITYIDFLKYDVYVFSRLFKNLRLTFNVPLQIDIKKGSIIRKNRRAASNSLNLMIGGLGFINFWGLLEDLYSKVFRHFFKYNMALYLLVPPMKGMSTKSEVFYKYVTMQWSDLYARITDLSEMITNRNNFMFKLEVPRVNYNLLMLVSWAVSAQEFLLVLFSFLGFDLYLKRRKFKFVFYSRII